MDFPKNYGKIHNRLIDFIEVTFICYASKTYNLAIFKHIAVDIVNVIECVK